jgi:hypothetical protein
MFRKRVVVVLLGLCLKVWRGYVTVICTCVPREENKGMRGLLLPVGVGSDKLNKNNCTIIAAGFKPREHH